MKLNECAAFGGLQNLNDDSIELRHLQISDGVMIHTCNDYKNSIEVIRKANFKKNKVSLILKVYFNYPDKRNRRFRDIFSQIDESLKRLTFLPDKFILQLCCCMPRNVLMSSYFENFIFQIKNRYSIERINLEYYPVYNYDFKLFNSLNNNFKGDFSFGITSYYNFLNRAITNKEYEILIENNIPFYPIGFLGKNAKRDKKVFLHDLKLNNDYENFDEIDLNIMFLLNHIKRNRKKVYGITETSSLKNYIDLKERFKKNHNIKDSYYNDLEIKILKKNKINLIEKDHYGGKHFFQEYLYNWKLFPSKIKKKIFYLKKSEYFFK